MRETKKYYNRIHLFEFEDLSWFPDIIRKGMLDYLSFFLNKVGYYKHAMQLIQECLIQSGSRQIIDLCSGAGGPAKRVHQELLNTYNTPVKMMLSDKFPNIKIVNQDSKEYNPDIVYIPESVDVLNVPINITGVRTMFSAFHHFRPHQAKHILQSAVDQKEPIAIFDGGDKNILMIFGIILFKPFIFFFCTPFIKPFRWNRLLFTYIIPLIPLCTIWDGVISVFRFYSPKAMLIIANEVDSKTYCWKAGKMNQPLGFKMTFLIGYPIKNVNRNLEKGGIAVTKGFGSGGVT